MVALAYGLLHDSRALLHMAQQLVPYPWRGSARQSDLPRSP